MPHIQQLDSHVADLIAAGEVAERAPAMRHVAGDPGVGGPGCPAGRKAMGDWYEN